MSDSKDIKEEELSGLRAIERVRGLLKHFHTAMFTTMCDGKLRTRPMGIPGKPEDFDGVLWFITDDRAHKVDEIGEGRTVSLLMQSDANHAYLHLRGSATMSRDRAKLEQLYSPLLKTWFPDGLDDPHMTLVRFEAESGDFWDSPGGMLQVIAAFAKAVVTGTPGQGGNLGHVTL